MRPEKIREILLTDWDPLNVGDSPMLADEYDRYIPEIARLLNNGASAAEIEQLLQGIETSWGISPDPKKTSNAAIHLASR